MSSEVPAGFGTGLIARDYKKHPVGSYAGVPEFPADQIIDKAEWADRWEIQKAAKANLLALREAEYDTLKSLNQGRLGLCWAFSSTKAMMYLRARDHQPNVILSAWYVAGMIKRWRDEGGWNAASLEFIIKYGVPSIDLCPSYSSKYDTPEAKADAATHQCTEWFDGSDDPELAQRQLVTSLLLSTPCAVDLNVMGHSMCAVDIGSLNPVEIIYDNSWGDGGEKGLYRGRGVYARPNGLVVPRVIEATTV